MSFFESHDDECTARPETSRSQATNGSLASRRLNTNHIKDEEDNIEAQQTILTHQSPVTLSSRISSEQLMESIDYSITGSRKPSPRKGPTSAVSNTSKMVCPL